MSCSCWPFRAQQPPQQHPPMASRTKDEAQRALFCWLTVHAERTMREYWHAEEGDCGSFATRADIF
jgi:hypothetical protein